MVEDIDMCLILTVSRSLMACFFGMAETEVPLERRLFGIKSKHRSEALPSAAAFRQPKKSSGPVWLTLFPNNAADRFSYSGVSPAAEI